MLRALRHLARLAAMCATLVSAASAAAAQGTNTPAPHGDSVSALADSDRAIAALIDTLRRAPTDASRWNRLGMLAAARSRDVRRNGVIWNQHKIDLLRIADSALYKATRLDPDNARYKLEYAHQLFGASATTLALSMKTMERALADAERAGDSALVGEISDQLGMLHWTRYDENANRREFVPAMSGGVDYDTLRKEKYGGLHLLNELTWAPRPPLGREEYDQAVDWFERAMRASPSVTARHVYMALADHEDWLSLDERATERTRHASWDLWAWMGRGLAEHRMGREVEAAESFDSAFAVMDSAEHARFTRLSRILRPGDSARYMQQRATTPGFDRLFWMTADPLAMTPGNEYEMEFYARVAYAELRWSLEDFDLHGADTERGDIFARYGPPTTLANLPEPQGLGSGTAFWYYRAFDRFFLFHQPRSYGTAELEMNDRSLAESMRETMPVAWRNLRVSRVPIDSIPVLISRFRADPVRGDSADVVAFADLPLGAIAGRIGWLGRDSLRDAMDSTSEALRGHRVRTVATAWFAFTPGGELITRDSSSEQIAAGDSTRVDRHAWRHRYAAGNGIVYRVEALEPDHMRAARALGLLPLAVNSGFGMSDVLLAERVQPKIAAPLRWTDFVLSPMTGSVSRDASLALLWETYALADSGGASRYRVDITVQASRANGQSIAARILGGARKIVDVSARGADRVTLTYARQVAKQPVIVDDITLKLSDLASGSYEVILSVRDLIAGRTAESRREIVVRR